MGEALVECVLEFVDVVYADVIRLCAKKALAQNFIADLCLGLLAESIESFPIRGQKVPSSYVDFHFTE